MDLVSIRTKQMNLLKRGSPDSMMVNMRTHEHDRDMPVKIVVSGVELELYFTDDQTGDYIHHTKMGESVNDQRWYTPVYREY